MMKMDEFISDGKPNLRPRFSLAAACLPDSDRSWEQEQEREREWEQGRKL